VIDGRSPCDESAAEALALFEASDFLRPRHDGPLVHAGEDAGDAFECAAPDLGAFEVRRGRGESIGRRARRCAGGATSGPFHVVMVTIPLSWLPSSGEVS